MSGARTVNLVLVAVIYVALVFGPVTGLLAAPPAAWRRMPWPAASSGSAACRRRIVGFLVGLLGAQFIVAQPLPRFVMFVVGDASLHELCYQALYALVESRPFRLAYSPVLTQAAINGIVGLAGVFHGRTDARHAPAAPRAARPILR